MWVRVENCLHSRVKDAIKRQDLVQRACFSYLCHKEVKSLSWQRWSGEGKNTQNEELFFLNAKEGWFFFPIEK